MARSRRQLKKNKAAIFARYRAIRFRAKKKMLRQAEEKVLQESIFDSEISTFSMPEDFQSDRNIRDLLRAWVNCHGITTRAVNNLLKILKNAGTL